MCLVIGSVSYVCECATHALSQRLGMEKEDKENNHYHNELIIIFRMIRHGYTLTLNNVRVQFKVNII